MKRFLRRPAIVLLGALALLLTGGVVAYATWSVGSNGAKVVAKAATMPRGERPAAVRRGATIAVSWAPSFIRRGTPVDGYRVTRHAANGRTKVVCSVGTTQCTDADVRVGSWTYTVQPTVGRGWIGASSVPSRPVEVRPATTQRVVDAQDPAAGASALDVAEVPQTTTAADDVRQPAGDNSTAQPRRQVPTPAAKLPATAKTDGPDPEEPAVTKAPEPEPEPTEEPEPVASGAP